VSLPPLRARAIRSALAAAGLVAVVLGSVALVPPAAAVGLVSGLPPAASVRAGSSGGAVTVGRRRPADGRTTDVHVLAFNDFHGALEPGTANIHGRFAGGAAYLSRLLHERQSAYPGRVTTVTAGDLVGASPLSNALFHEEPTIVAANLMGVELSAVGNHEFDKGVAELRRLQRGGCHPRDGCTGAPYARAGRVPSRIFPGADFRYLAANVLTDKGRSLFPTGALKSYRTGSGTRVRVGFVAATLRETPTVVSPAAVSGLTFADEADAANRAVADLRRRGSRVNVLLLHQGMEQTSPASLGSCNAVVADSAIEKIARRLDPSVKVIVTGHTHAEYRCTITAGGTERLVTSTASNGRVLSDITLTVDDRTGEFVSAGARNTIVENALDAYASGAVRQADTSREDPQVRSLVEQYVTASAPLAGKVLGRIRGDLTRVQNAGGESSLGDVVADAQLAATSAPDRGAATVAFLNPGGIRADLKTSDISAAGEAPGEVTYGEAFTVQPFGNNLVTKTLTGAQIRTVLQQQFAGCHGQKTTRILQISHTLRYRRALQPLPVAPTEAECAAAIGEIDLGGHPVVDAATYRVTVNSFLASGGDGFTVLAQGTDPIGGGQDLEALVRSLREAGPDGLAVPELERILPL
jgi:5'-nucleotidase